MKGGGGIGIKMSWVEKNLKINNRGQDDYSGLECTRWIDQSHSALMFNNPFKMQLIFS